MLATDAEMYIYIYWILDIDPRYFQMEVYPVRWCAQTVADLLAQTLAEAGVERMLKAIINGRGDEIVELAKTNLRL
jgi:hypothetical protein